MQFIARKAAEQSEKKAMATAGEFMHRVDGRAATIQPVKVKVFVQVLKGSKKLVEFLSPPREVFNMIDILEVACLHHMESLLTCWGWVSGHIFAPEAGEMK